MDYTSRKQAYSSGYIYGTDWTAGSHKEVNFSGYDGLGTEAMPGQTKPYNIGQKWVQNYFLVNLNVVYAVASLG